MLYKNTPVIVLEEGAVLSRIYDEGKEEYHSYNVPTKLLKLRQVKLLSGTEKALSQDPEVLAAMIPHVLRIEISCAPNAIDACALDISTNSELSETSAVDYIRVVTDKSHGAKFDIIIDSLTPQFIQDRLGVFFNENGHRAKGEEIQIGSKSLALWLMREHNFKPSRG